MASATTRPRTSPRNGPAPGRMCCCTRCWRRRRLWGEPYRAIFDELSGGGVVSTDNIVLEHLCAIRATLDRHTDDLHEIKGRLGTLEQQYASISNRVDRIDERLY